MSQIEMFQYLDDSGIGYERKVQLSDFSYLRTGGEASVIVFPKNEDELSRVIAFFFKNRVKYKVIGNTSNLLFLDETSYTCLVSTRLMTSIGYSAETGDLFADAGVMLPDVSRLALLHSIAGFEGLEGIPGSVGGSIFMNAGAYGTEIKDVIREVSVISLDGVIKTYSIKELELGHRNSIFRNKASGEVISRCVFRGVPGDSQKIYKDMEVFHAKRHKYQDFFYPNLGSIFSGSPYRALGKDDAYFRFVSAVYYFFCYEWKIFRRESPNNRKWLNDILVKRFNFDYEVQPFSDKTLNCLVNRGQGTAEMVRFIEELKTKTKGRIPLENEIVEGF